VLVGLYARVYVTTLVSCSISSLFLLDPLGKKKKNVICLLLFIVKILVPCSLHCFITRYHLTFIFPFLLFLCAKLIAVSFSRKKTIKVQLKMMLN